MSQVDDWSDGYTSDYLRDLNTYGPASANVPRSSVVSHRVQYRAPDTSDIPLAPGQNPEGSVYSNASGARMGQTNPASGYRAPAGGGWDVNSSDANLRFSNESGGKQYRVSRTQTAKKTVKKQAQTGKKQAQPDKKQPQPEYRTGGARTPEENEIARSAAEHRTGADLGQLSSQALEAAAHFLPALKLLGFGAGAGSADTASTDRPSYMGAAGTMADNFARTLPQPSAASRQPAPESSSVEDQFKNMPWYEDAKAHYEAVKKNMDDHGSALGMLKSTWDDIPWWAMVDPAGAPAKAAAAAAAAEGRRLYSPVVERLLAPRGPLTGGASEARTTLTSVDEGLPVGYSLLRESPKGTSAWRGAAADYGVSPAGGSVKLDLNGMPGAAGREVAAAGGQAADWTSNLAQQLRAAGIPEDQIAASIARINAEAAGREAAAAGREAAAAGGQAAGREAAAGAGRAGEAAADGGVSELANAGNAGRETAAGGAAARQGAGEAAEAGGQAAGRGAAPAAEAGRQAPADRLAALPDWAMGQVPTSQLQAMIEAAVQNDPIARSVFSKIAFAKHGSVAWDSFLSRGLSKFFNREDLITIGNAINRARKTGGVND